MCLIYVVQSWKKMSTHFTTKEKKWNNGNLSYTHNKESKTLKCKVCSRVFNGWYFIKLTRISNNYQLGDNYYFHILYLFLPTKSNNKNFYFTNFYFTNKQ